MSPWHEFFDARRLVQLAAFALATAAAGFLLTAPMGTGETTSVTSDGTVITTTGATTLVQTEGRSVVWLLLAPVLVVAVHAFWWGRGRTAAIIACTAVLGLFCLAGMLSVGLFYLPAAVVGGLALVAPAGTTSPAGPPAPRPA